MSVSGQCQFRMLIGLGIWHRIDRSQWDDIVPGSAKVALPAMIQRIALHDAGESMDAAQPTP